MTLNFRSVVSFDGTGERWTVTFFLGENEWPEKIISTLRTHGFWQGITNQYSGGFTRKMIMHDYVRQLQV
jgi:hypothetical protein